MVGRKKIIGPGQIPVLSIVFFAVVVTNVPRLSELLVYDRRAILNGELWRLLTAPLVHFSASHLFWDAVVFGAAGISVIASGFRGLWPVCGFGTVVPGLIYLLWFPGLERYGGLSGLATGALAYCCLCNARQSGCHRTIWLLILAGTGLKIVFETVTGTPVFARVESIAYHVLPSAHLIGFLGAVATIILYRRKNSWTNSEKSLTFPVSNSLLPTGEIAMQNTEERIKALETALDNETWERNFYLKHSERTSHPLGKSMFKTIAEDESEHYQRILELHRKLKEAGKWPADLPLTVKETPVKSVLKKVVEAVGTNAQADSDDVAAVKIAIEFETKGEKFYQALHDAVEDPREKTFFGMLADLEREHRLSLEDTLEYFQDPEGWFRMKEGHHLDGA